MRQRKGYVRFEVEIYPEKPGPASVRSVCETRDAALALVLEAYRNRQGYSVIARDQDGLGRALVLDLIPANEW
jgi:hypothetical protein